MERPVLRPTAPLFALLVSGAVLLSGGLAASAGADVLVLRDGSRIETDGSWQAKGRQLIFKTASGTLSTLRASEVDLAASEQATAEAAAPKAQVAAKPAVEKRPVLVITDKDVPKASPEATAEVGGAAETAAAAVAASGSTSGRVEVVSSNIEAGEGDEAAFAVKGVVQNNSLVPVAEVGVLVVATVTRDNDNRRVYCQAAVTSPLAPKGTAEFTCPVRRQDVLATGMADAFGSAVLSFEVRATPQAPPPDAKTPQSPQSPQTPQN